METDLTSMKFILILFATISLFGCQMESKKKGIQEEIKALDYKDISIKIDFGDEEEVHQYEEYVSGIDDDLKFKLADKIINDAGDEEVVRYELTEIDTKNKICVKHLAAFLPASDSAEYYNMDTLLQKVESRSFYVEKKEYFVYKIQEIDEFMGSCNTSIVSPDFGFLLGKGSVGSFVISQDSKNETIAQLINKIKQDTVFINCNKDLIEISNQIEPPHFHNH